MRMTGVSPTVSTMLPNSRPRPLVVRMVPTGCCIAFSLSVAVQRIRYLANTSFRYAPASKASRVWFSPVTLRLGALNRLIDDLLRQHDHAVHVPKDQIAGAKADATA